MWKSWTAVKQLSKNLGDFTREIVAPIDEDEEQEQEDEQKEKEEQEDSSEAPDGQKKRNERRQQRQTRDGDGHETNHDNDDGHAVVDGDGDRGGDDAQNHGFETREGGDEDEPVHDVTFDDDGRMVSLITPPPPPSPSASASALSSTTSQQQPSRDTPSKSPIGFSSWSKNLVLQITTAASPNSNSNSNSNSDSNFTPITEDHHHHHHPPPPPPPAHSPSMKSANVGDSVRGTTSEQLSIIITPSPSSFSTPDNNIAPVGDSSLESSDLSQPQNDHQNSTILPQIQISNPSTTTTTTTTPNHTTSVISSSAGDGQTNSENSAVSSLSQSQIIESALDAFRRSVFDLIDVHAQALAEKQNQSQPPPPPIPIPSDASETISIPESATTTTTTTTTDDATAPVSENSTSSSPDDSTIPERPQSLRDEMERVIASFSSQLSSSLSALQQHLQQQQQLALSNAHSLRSLLIQRTGVVPPAVSGWDDKSLVDSAIQNVELQTRSNEQRQLWQSFMALLSSSSPRGSSTPATNQFRLGKGSAAPQTPLDLFGALLKELRATNEVNARMMDKLSLIESQRIQLMNDKEEVTQNLMRENASLRSLVEKLEHSQARPEIEAELINLDQELHAKHIAMERLSFQLKELSVQSQEAEMSHREEIAAVREEATQLLRENEKLKKQNREIAERLQSDSAASQQKAQTLQNEITRLTEQEERTKAENLATIAQLNTEIQQHQTNFETSQRELETTRLALNNLQDVLTIFKAERDSNMSQLVAELDRVRAELETAEKETARQRAELEALSHVRSELEQMRNESDEKEKLVSSLKAQVSSLRKALEDTIHRMNNDDMVDRRLVVKLLVTYIEGKNKEEVLDLMVKILQFNEEEKRRIQMLKNGGLGRWLGFGARTSDDGLPPQATLSELWVDFLMKESSKGTNNTALSQTQAFPALNSPNVTAWPSPPQIRQHQPPIT